MLMVIMSQKVVHEPQSIVKLLYWYSSFPYFSLYTHVFSNSSSGDSLQANTPAFASFNAANLMEIHSTLVTLCFVV